MFSPPEANDWRSSRQIGCSSQKDLRRILIPTTEIQQDHVRFAINCFGNCRLRIRNLADGITVIAQDLLQDIAEGFVGINQQDTFCRQSRSGQNHSSAFCYSSSAHVSVCGGEAGAANIKQVLFVYSQQTLGIKRIAKLSSPTRVRGAYYISNCMAIQWPKKIWRISCPAEGLTITGCL